LALAKALPQWDFTGNWDWSKVESRQLKGEPKNKGDFLS
jgi:hypothetical protein